MNKQLKLIGNFVSKNSPTILTGLAVAGLISTTVMAVKVTPKALMLIENEKDYRRKQEKACDISKKDVIKLTWKVYIPPTLMCGVTIACIIGANSIGTRRQAALAGAYSLAETSLKEYQSKVVETIGKNKEQQIRDDIAKDKVTNNPIIDEPIVTGKGNTLCYDALSGRYFLSDIESIRKVENEMNKALLQDNFISLNEVYDSLGLDRIALGDELGWSVWIDNDDSLVEFKFSSQISSKGTPCIVLDYCIRPRYDYCS